jgi:hypothetical protein
MLSAASETLIKGDSNFSDFSTGLTSLKLKIPTFSRKNNTEPLKRVYDGGVATTKESGKNPLQTPRETPVTASKGLKRPSPELAELLRLTNLVPTDMELPEIKLESSLTKSLAEMGEEQMASLPDPIRLYLREFPYPRDWSEGTKTIMMFALYSVIRNARGNLRRIIDGTREPLRFQAEAKRGAKGKLELHPDWTVKALLTAEIDYLARCAYSKCGKFFYAGRLGQPGCIPDHSDIIRKQRKRDREKEALRLHAEGKVKPRKNNRKRQENGRTTNKKRR